MRGEQLKEIYKILYRGKYRYTTSTDKAGEMKQAGCPVEKIKVRPENVHILTDVYGF